jgi:hypothetical protein
MCVREEGVSKMRRGVRVCEVKSWGEKRRGEVRIKEVSKHSHNISLQ